MTILLFEDGQFKNDDWPEFRESAEEDDADFFRSAGWTQLPPLGDANQFHFDIWQGETEGEWLVIVNTTGDLTCHVRCYGWIHFLELMSKISPIAIAGALHNGDHGTAFLFTANMQKDEKLG